MHLGAFKEDRGVDRIGFAGPLADLAVAEELGAVDRGAREVRGVGRGDGDALPVRGGGNLVLVSVSGATNAVWFRGLAENQIRDRRLCPPVPSNL